jgi:predicted O-methyltransferase YrrM
MRSILFGLATGLAVALLTALAGHLGASDSVAAVAAIVALAAGLAVLHHWKTQHFQSMGEGFQQITRKLNLLHDHVSETQGLVQIYRFNDAYPLPFGGGWALTADAAAVLVREIALNSPNTIVELGSGVSTVLIGRMLKQAGRGRLISLDHDPHWAEQTRKHVRASGLEDFVQVLDAPLGKQRFGDREYDWYQVPEQLRRAGEIDMLVVDGPPQRLDPSGTPRYPALPAFQAQLSPQALIFIDDAKRPQEQAMVERWLEEYPDYEHRMYETVPGTCLLRRKGLDTLSPTA